jgi:hypothetical protein
MHPRWRRFANPGLLLLVLLAAGGAVLFAIRHGLDAGSAARRGPVHHFPANAGDTFLTDTCAITIAQEAMRRDGHSTAQWQPLEDRRSSAPDGRPDVFLARNLNDPNRGTITFQAVDPAAPERFRYVVLERTDDGQVSVQVDAGK